MPLFKEVNGEFVQWLGEPINDVPYAMNIEERWSYESLASIGLYRPQEPDPAPEGSIIVSTAPGWVDGVVKYVHTLENAPTPVITAEMVNAVRDRRIAEGVAFNGKIFDLDPAAKQRVAGAATLAGFAIGNGAAPGDYYWHGGEQPFSWICKDNSIIQLDADEMFALGQTAANWESLHIFAARTIKDMDPIPLDYEDDIYWP